MAGLGGSPGDRKGDIALPQQLGGLLEKLLLKSWGQLETKGCHREDLGDCISGGTAGKSKGVTGF